MFISGTTSETEVQMSRSIEQLVDQQVSKWMAERRIADRASWRPPADGHAAHDGHRARAYATTRGLPDADARATVLRIAGERDDFYRESFKVDVREPSHFDLLLNPAPTGETQCAAIVAAAFEARFGPPKSEVRMR